MRLHANARLSLKGRELLIDRVEVAGWSLSTAAALTAPGPDTPSSTSAPASTSLALPVRPRGR